MGTGAGGMRKIRHACVRDPTLREGEAAHAVRLEGDARVRNRGPPPQAQPAFGLQARFEEKKMSKTERASNRGTHW